ncbi:MAG: EF-hand domain-containing protein, partial [Candidatus Wallbacteria bacterium]
MKYIKALAIGVAASSLLCTAAFPQDQTSATSETSIPKKGYNHIKEMLQKFDIDGDGKLSETEKNAAMAEAQAKFKEELEKNTELKAKLIEKFDADKDGALSDSELKTAMESKPGKGGRGGGKDQMISKFDTDGDGKLSDTEKTAAMAEAQTKFKEELEKNTELKAKLI